MKSTLRDEPILGTRTTLIGDAAKLQSESKTGLVAIPQGTVAGAVPLCEEAV